MSKGDKGDQLCHLKPTLEKASLGKGLQEAPSMKKRPRGENPSTLAPGGRSRWLIAPRPHGRLSSGVFELCDSIASRSLCISYFNVEVGVLSSPFFGGAFEHRFWTQGASARPRALIRGDLKMHDCRRRAACVCVCVRCTEVGGERVSTEPHQPGDSREFGGQASAELDGGDGAV